MGPESHLFFFIRSGVRGFQRSGSFVATWRLRNTAIHAQKPLRGYCALEMGALKPLRSHKVLEMAALKPLGSHAQEPLEPLRSHCALEMAANTSKPLCASKRIAPKPLRQLLGIDIIAASTAKPLCA